MGTGGAPQGVLAAAALRCVGGRMQGRLACRDEGERAQAADCGIEDPERKYGLEDMAAGDVTLAATGITGGNVLDGVRRVHGVCYVHVSPDACVPELPGKAFP